MGIQPKKVSMLVRGAIVITNPLQGESGIHRNTGVAITDDGKVAEVEDYDSIVRRYPNVPVEGGAKDLVIPGLIDAHSHGNGLSYFELGLGYNHLEYWNLFQPSVLKSDPYFNSLWCGIKHLRSGCTTIHHMANLDTWEAVEAPIKAYRDLGIRRAFSLTVKDKNLITYDDSTFISNLPTQLAEHAKNMFLIDPSEVYSKYFDLFRRLQFEYHSPEAPVILGPMGPQWCSPEILSKMKAEADRHDLRIHMHAIQTPYQKEIFFKKFGCSAITYLNNLGFLGSNLTLGHAVWLNESDVELLSEKGCSITHHASCNLNMRNGIMPLPFLMSKGIVVAVGIDNKGINDDEDMIQELRIIEKIHRIADLSCGAPPALRSAQILAMATINGANVLGLDKICGTLDPGMAADIAIIELEPKPWMNPDISPFDQLIMKAKGTDVKTVIVGGRVIMRDCKILTVDENEILSKLVESIGPNKNPQAKAKADLLAQLSSHVLDFYKHWRVIPEVSEPYYLVNSKR